MTRVLLLATTPSECGGPAALLGWEGTSSLQRLVVQARSTGASEVTVLTRSEWLRDVAAVLPDGVGCGTANSLNELLQAAAAVATERSEALLIGHADMVLHRSLLEGVLSDPRVATGILSSARTPQGNQAFGVRIVRGRVVAAESPYHAVRRASGVSLGVLKVSAGDLPDLAHVAAELADICAEGVPARWEGELAWKVERWGRAFFRRNTAALALAQHLERQPLRASWIPDVEVLREELDRQFNSAVLHPARAATEDVVALLTTGLVRRGVKLTSAYLRGLVWSRALSGDAVEQVMGALEEVDEDKVLLDAAVKATDGFFTTFFVSPYSRHIARWCAGRGFTPNQVTTFSMALGVLAAVAFAFGTRAGLVTGAILLQAAFTADCVDGQLARYTRRFSKFGAWLDSVFDRSKEYAVYAGLAVGGARAGLDDVWLLAAAAIGLQTVRHTVDFSYAATQHEELALEQQAPLTEPEEQPADLGRRISPRDAGRDEQQVGDTQVPVGGSGRLRDVGRLGVRASVYFEQRSWMKWGKRILVLPIGERFALISITAALTDARTTFVALLVWGVIALTYTALGRILRSFA